ncbi:transglutaminase family protein, partial [Candidatus Omnitrophota bacterium]
LEKVQAIYNFCAEDIRYVAVEYGQAGYEPHKASDIFFNKYGDCKDQAILLVTMLREIGVPGMLVLIGTYDYLNLEEDFPSVNFNHCIAAVRLDGELIFLDPTCSTCSFGVLPAGDQDRKVLLFSGAGYEIVPIPVYPAADNRLEQSLKIQISPDETIQAQRSVSSFGLFDASQRMWLKYSSGDAVSETLKQVIQDISPAARLTEYDIDNLDDLNRNITLRYAFSGKEYWMRAGQLRILPQLAALNTSVVAKQSRRYPIDLGIPTRRIVKLDLSLPQVIKVNYLPDSFSRSSPWVDIAIRYDVEEGRLYFEQITQTKKRVIPLSEYSQFKAFMEDVSAQVRERVVFVYD